MIQRKFPAVFMRGGTSKALMFRIEGSTIWKAARRNAGDTLRLGDAFRCARGGRGSAPWQRRKACHTRVSFYRTARRLFDGHVYA